MSRLKLKVNNCLLNNNGIFNKIGFNCFIIFQDYLNIKILKYDENFEILCNFWVLKFYIFFLIFKFWNFLKLLNFNFFFGIFWPPTDGISTPLPMEYRPHTHGISTPLPMVFWPLYPWYFDPPIHGILTPLLMLYWPLTHGI